MESRPRDRGQVQAVGVRREAPGALVAEGGLLALAAEKQDAGAPQGRGRKDRAGARQVARLGVRELLPAARGEVEDVHVGQLLAAEAVEQHQPVRVAAGARQGDQGGAPAGLRGALGAGRDEARPGVPREAVAPEVVEPPRGAAAPEDVEVVPERRHAVVAPGLRIMTYNT